MWNCVRSLTGADSEYFPDTPRDESPASAAIMSDSSDEEEAVSAHDDKEEKSVDDFLAGGCGSLLGPKKSPCSKLFSRSEISATRMNCLELSNTELDMMVLANLDAHRHSGDGNTGNSRASIDYYFHGRRVCKVMYLFLHAIGPKKYKNLVTHFGEHGLVPRRHGNTRRLAANAISFAKTENVVAFIRHFSTIHALPLPGRMPGQYSGEKVLLLPSNMSKRYVYQQYCCACNEEGEIPVKRRKFENLWKELVPHIACMKPASDLCDTCHGNVTKIMRSANLPESEKSECLKEAERHLMLAKQERELYNMECKKATEEHESSPETASFVHCSFDFAQQVHFPCSPQQVGALYFLKPRKCQLFGVCSEAKGEQVNYLIDENDYIGKGANCAVSLLHHYLENNTSSNQHLLHADNATGQNKNNTVIHYLAWRVLTERNPTIKISFMIVGHTKFSPDRFFRLVKKKYRCTYVSTLDLEQVVKNSSVGGHNIAQPTVNCSTGERYVVWYNWSEHLSKFFRPLPGILKFHHIKFEKSAPGKFCKGVCP